MENLDEIIFYSLERSIKTYRQFAQRNINLSDSDITIDQWLVMKSILENSELKQNEIAVKVFKDAASVNRIIDLLIKKEYLSRKVHDEDRRRTSLQVTKKGKDILSKVQVVINKNRASALKGINEKDLKIMRDVLSKITYNCRVEES